MKTNKFWSILMMFVLVLGAAFTFSSCGDDKDDDVADSGNSSSFEENIMVAAGRSYKIYGATSEVSSNGLEILFSASNGAEMQVKLNSETIPVGDKVEVRKIEFEYEDYEVECKTTTYMSVKKSGSQYTISFEDVKGYDSDGKTKYMSLYYQGKVYEN